MQEVLTGLYAWLFVVLPVLGLFGVLLAARPPARPSGNMFEAVSVQGKETLSAGLSAVVAVVFMMLGLLFMVVLIVRFGVIANVLYMLLVAHSTWRILDRQRFRALIDRCLYNRDISWEPISWESIVLQGAVSGLFGMLWFLFPIWPIIDVTVLLVAFDVAYSFGPLKLRTIAIGFAALVVFDVFGVLVSGLTVQLANAALTSTDALPIIFIVPQSLSSWDLNYLAALGLGDIIIGALMVISMDRFGLARWAALGWAIAILIGLVQPLPYLPALVAIVPCVFVCTGIGRIVQRRKRKPDPEFTMSNNLD